VGIPDWDHLGFPVLGAVSGMLGTLAATETIKVLTNFGMPLYFQKLYFDMSRMEFKKFNIRQNQNCPVCAKTTIKV
jgi:molybdopterin/thiamine biosynthesis adenylyltransferase